MQKNLDSLSFQVDKNIVEQVYEIYMISFSPDGKQISVVNHVEMKSFPAEGAEVPIHKHPLVKMPYKAAQELLDELWHVGLRPSNVKSLDGQIEAMQAHIDDLRWIIKAHVVGETND